MSGYNGWTNYETWNVKLWLDNDEGSYLYWRERAEERYAEGKAGEDMDSAVSDLRDELQSSHEENMPEVHGTYADLLGAALSEVNWHEIAESLMEDAKENVEDAEGRET